MYVVFFFYSAVRVSLLLYLLIFYCLRVLTARKPHPARTTTTVWKKPHTSVGIFSVYEICVFVVCHSSDLRRRRIVRFDYYYILPIIFRRYKRGFRRRTADVIYVPLYSICTHSHKRYYTKQGWACAIIRKILCACV